ncbi:LOW QUALITY PROTEIN: uncharacterized protein [Phyllobates terribilis]|uniref:LOW QUALITY PROTEIN: uncharacterized protein n=1 Tax=Phyllobates terribilis TaxID=111132 RepID=UPI003CCB7057
MLTSEYTVPATTKKSSDTTKKPDSFEDNPGDLPDDALRKDGGKQDKADEVDRDIQVSEESSFTQNQYHKINQESVDHSGKRTDKGKTGNDDQHDKTYLIVSKPSSTMAYLKQNQQVTFSDETKKDQSGKQQSEYSTKKNDNQQAQEPEKESKDSKKSWSTQANESSKEKQKQPNKQQDMDDDTYGITWKLCNATSGPDYIPCLDNTAAIKKLKSTKHFEHRERHCPDDPPTCLVSLPEHYKKPISWPESRTKIWFHNVPHTELAKIKGHQNWVKLTGEFLTFPGGGTQFIHGALNYIDFIEKTSPSIAWGKLTRVVLDVGCGVASFGGFLFDKNVHTMSFAPKDEHEAQVQFALERGIPAISAVMGSKRLPFPSGSFDLIHCARCRVPWHAEGGRLLLELNRMLRPGGYFVWSATPVYQTLPEDVEIWNAMSNLTKSMCWSLETIQKDKVDKVAAAIYRKPTDNDCYKERKEENPPMCESSDDPDAAWYVPLQTCMQWVPTDEHTRGSSWPLRWPERLKTPPYWLNKTQLGIYGKPAPQDFIADYKHWKYVMNTTYRTSLGINWSDVRNVIDMRAVYGGFAAALADLNLWVLNVVNVNAPDTLPIIFERGLFGIYHDWCESFSTYPRSYDLLHADHLFSQLKKRCNLTAVMAEVDRIVRPGGYLIVLDESDDIDEVEKLLKSLHWEVHFASSKDQERILVGTKSYWRP